MTETAISSRDNPVFKRLRKLAGSRLRADDVLVIDSRMRGQATASMAKRLEFSSSAWRGRIAVD